MNGYSNELYHYGVMGMKWGIRRYQNPDGTLTREGRKRAREEYKADNKKAFELGRAATVSGSAYAIAQYKSSKYQNKLKRISDKRGADKISQKQFDKLMVLAIAEGLSKKKYEDAVFATQKHVENLRSKYGNEAVSDVKKKTDKQGRTLVNERVIRGSEWIASGILSVGVSALFQTAGVPFVTVFTPESKESLAKSEYDLNKQIAKAMYKTKK